MVDPESWRLRVDGRVGHELSLSLDELRSRPAVTLAVTLECAGNGRAALSPRPLSQPWLLEAVGTAEWTGTPLRALLDEAGVGEDAADVLFRALDRGVEGGEEQQFERSLPLAEALREEVLLAYAMNGRPLPPQHGFPLRLVVPGWYGMTSVKWVERITVLDQPFEGYQQARGYRIRQTPDEDGEPVSRMPRLVGLWPRGACRGQRRRRRELERCAARPPAVEVGVAPMGVGLGAPRARPLRALLPRNGRSGQRPASDGPLEPRRLRQQRGPARLGRRRERYPNVKA